MTHYRFSFFIHALVLLFYALILSVVTTSSVYGKQNNADQQYLYFLINARFELMEAVAYDKWQNNIAIENKQREAAVLQSVADNALSYQLNPQQTKAFFQLQIQLAKKIQAAYFRQWQIEPAQPSELTLDQVRPLLINLGADIVRYISKYKQASSTINRENKSSTHAISQIVKHPYLDQTDLETLSKALEAIQIMPNPQASSHNSHNRLDQIRQRGKLRVGTTGDYAPFSFSEKENQFSGIDIALAKNLSESLDVELEFYQTTWPTLIEDLNADQFDIAMSGITIKLFRQYHGLFSEPYYIGGKTPIIRCEDKPRFASLATIDQPGVRLIVNPGGTNEHFARENIKQADIKVYPDNNTIFLQILNRHADVMITDDIEVKLQTKKNPTLCAALDNKTLNKHAKGFLIQQDLVLKAYIDIWLAEQKLSGELDRLFTEALSN